MSASPTTIRKGSTCRRTTRSWVETPRRRSGRSGCATRGGSASMTRPAGGTGGFIIADVGENAVEELNYLPAGRAGRNFGWRNREGANDHETSLPPAFEPLTDPIFEYRPRRRTLDYRRLRLPRRARAVDGRSIRVRRLRARPHLVARPRDRPGDRRGVRPATCASTRARSAPALSLRMISSFGIDAAGELYVVNYGDGTIIALKPAEAAAPIIRIDTPTSGVGRSAAVRALGMGD